MDFFTSSLAHWKAVCPDKPAFIDAASGCNTGWKELYDEVTGIAAEIIELRRDIKKPVAVLVDRTPLSVAAMLAVNAAGGWYVPIDGELSLERINLLLSVCCPDIILDCRDNPAETGDIPLIQLKNSVSRSAPSGSLPQDFGESRPRDIPLFGIFTSGSTGTPKLVVKSFEAMYSFTEVYCKTFGFGHEEIFGSQIPFYFDASTKDIYSTLMLGATCVILPGQMFSFPINLVKTLNDYKISTVVWVPSALGIAARFNVFAASIPLYLKNVLFVGERMPVKYLNVWMDSLPECRFVNLYGSTEVAGNSCYYVIDRRFEDSDILPIGKPFEGTEVFLLNPETGLAGKEGEIAVSGPGLADGYYGDTEKTAKAFVIRTVGGIEKRLYLSGDFGKLDPDGNFVCISRRDSQIKHMGHRIELGEIESAACALSGTDEACCFYDTAKEKIILYFSSAEDKTAEIRRGLAEKLPKYMLPHKYIYLPSLPHNRNGKIDRAELKLRLGL